MKVNGVVEVKPVTDVRAGDRVLVEAVVRRGNNGVLFTDISDTYNRRDMWYPIFDPTRPRGDCIGCKHFPLSSDLYPCSECGEEHIFFDRRSE